VRDEGAVVTVRNDGRRFPEVLLWERPQRFLAGAAGRGQGTGLGPTIAFGQAQVIGARVSPRDGYGGGAVAEVVLPSAGAVGAGRVAPTWRSREPTRPRAPEGPRGGYAPYGWFALASLKPLPHHTS
jgi:hypothetical protein